MHIESRSSDRFVLAIIKQPQGFIGSREHRRKQPNSVGSCSRARLKKAPGRCTECALERAGEVRKVDKAALMGSLRYLLNSPLGEDVETRFEAALPDTVHHGASMRCKYSRKSTR